MSRWSRGVLLGLSILLQGAFDAKVQAQTPELIAGWDFQTTATGGTALNAQDAAQPTVFSANVGSGTLYLDGTQGSSSWISSATATRELNAFTGTGVNASNGLSTVTTSPAALALLNTTANGKSVVLRFSMSGYSGLQISLAAQRTSSGFTSQVWEYSTDGATYLPIGTLGAGSAAGTIASSFATSGILNLPTVTALNGVPNAYVRVTFSGATNGTGNNRVDNIQLVATPAATGPTIFTTASLSPFETSAGVPSAAQSFQVNGTLLTAGISVAAPSGFEVSADGTSFGPTATVPQSGGEASGTIYLRISASAPEGAVSGNVTLSSTGAADVTVPVTGVVNAAGTPVVSVVGSLTPFNTLAGTASSAQSLAVSGSSLSEGIAVQAPAGFEFSLDGGATYQTSGVIPQTSGAASATVFVRIAATASGGSPTGDLSLGTTGLVEPVLVPLSGTVTLPNLTLVLAPNTVAENAGPDASIGTVSIPSLLATDLTVTLNSGSPSNAVVHASVIIPAGQTSATFGVTPVPNPSVFTTVSVPITASATGYNNGSATLTVTNSDVPPVTQISITSTNANSYVQNFNSLGTTTISNVVSPTAGVQTSLGAVANSALDGWYVAKIITNSNTSLSSVFANDGSANAGAVYNYGSTNAAEGQNLDRSLGALAGTLVPGFGALIKNDTTNTLTALSITMTAKFWRSSTSATNVLTFGYGRIDGTNATESNFITATNGVTAFPDLNVVGPAPVATNAALNGNDITNQRSFNGIVVPVSLAPGQTAFIRWQDANEAGSDAGLAIDDFIITAVAGALVAPEFDLPAGVYLDAQTVRVSNFSSYGPGVEVRYTLDGSTPGAGSLLYDDATGIAIVPGNGTVDLRAIAINTGSSASSAVASVAYTMPQDVANLTVLRASPTGSTIYRVTGEVTFTAGTGFRNTKFFQDAAAGIQIDDSTGIITTLYVAGDNVQNIIGRISTFNGQLQMVPLQDFGAPVSSGNVVTPLSRTIATLSNADQAMLVTMVDVEFEQAGTPFGAGGSNTPITDPSVTGFAGVCRNIFGESNITGSTIPFGPNTLTGIVQSALVNTVQTLTVGPRSLSDIVFTGTPSLNISTDKTTLVAGVTSEATDATVTITRTGSTASGLVLNLTQDVANALTADLLGTFVYTPLPTQVTMNIGEASRVIYLAALPSVPNFNVTMTVSADTFEPVTQTFSVQGSGGGSPYDTWAGGYGLDPATDGAPTADPDGDSFTNEQEYAFGTSPIVANGALLTTSASGGNLVVSWLERSDVTYNVQSTANLATTAFANDGTVSVVNGPAEPTPPAGYTRKQFTVPTTGSKFYRVSATVPASPGGASASGGTLTMGGPAPGGGDRFVSYPPLTAEGAGTLTLGGGNTLTPTNPPSTDSGTTSDFGSSTVAGEGTLPEGFDPAAGTFAFTSGN